MAFITVNFYILVIFLLLIYYIAPLKYRWIVLLLGSLCFYHLLDKQGFGRLLMMVILSYTAAMILSFLKKKKENGQIQLLVLWLSILFIVRPLFMIKEGNFISVAFLGGETKDYIIPLGIAFYTLQMIGYLTDIYNGKATCQKNFAKYVLFVTYFPQIVQGPIPRYEKMQQLYEEHPFHEETFVKGIHLIIWGFFLKLMIADKAGIIVNTVFGSPEIYKGWYILLAGVLYSLQLYTDFQACVCIAKGVSALFGIHLADNFRNPYFSKSIKEFWQRWHISLSSWFRDYIYIPLGGNRRGRVRKWINVYIVFVISGIWHGAGYKYIFWGLMHATYQLVGSVTEKLRTTMYKRLHIKQNSFLAILIKRSVTFLLVMLAWIIFRADSLHGGLAMIASMVTVWNPWVVFSDTVFSLGLDWKDFMVLIASSMLLLKISCIQQKRGVSDWILNQHLFIRWGLYIISIINILVFGTYGFGFDAQDFIYGGF